MAKGLKPTAAADARKSLLFNEGMIDSNSMRDRITASRFSGQDIPQCMVKSCDVNDVTHVDGSASGLPSQNLSCPLHALVITAFVQHAFLFQSMGDTQWANFLAQNLDTRITFVGLSAWLDLGLQ